MSPRYEVVFPGILRRRTAPDALALDLAAHIREATPGIRFNPYAPQAINALWRRVRARMLLAGRFA